MAGIGEASAIVAVAQAGISLSMVIIAYVGDVRDAPKSVSRIGNEIKSTSGRLEEIADIIKNNPTTRLLLDTAVGDATRCSSECELILAQVGNLLVRGGWKRDSIGLSKDDIDASVVASLRWPFLKSRLDTPRAELQRIKADLILLFNVAMARKSSTPLTNEYAQKIPLLTKKKQEAARRAEEARSKARESQDHDNAIPTKIPRTRSPRAHGRLSQIAEEDPELSQQFWELELQRAKEQENRKIQERAAFLQAENDKKTKAEEDRKREIAQEAVEEYKLQQEELKAKTMAREKQLGDELLALGLGPEQITSILAIPSLNVDDIRSNVVPRPQSPESQPTSTTEVARRPKPQDKRRSGFPIKFLSWGGNSNSQLSDREITSRESKLQGKNSYQFSRRTDHEDSIELWLVDVFSRQHTELALSERWMSHKLERIAKFSNVYRRFAQLQPMWRGAIEDFLKARNKAERPEQAWKLIHIGLPRRMTKMSIFGHHHKGQLVRLIISRRKTADQAVNSAVLVLKGGIDKTFPSTVRASTYLPRQLVCTPAIRDSSYDYQELFEVPSDNDTPELREVTDKTHVMIPEALTLKQVNRLASLTKSLMEGGRVPWAAQPLFTYTVIQKETHYDEWEREYSPSDHGPVHTAGRLTPAHKFQENQQRGRWADRGPEASRQLKPKIEGSIDYLKQRRSDIGEIANPEDRVWLREIDTMISVLRRNLAKLDPQAANTNDYAHEDDDDGIPSRSHYTSYPARVTHPSEEENLYREDEFQSRNLGLANVERSSMNRKPPRTTSDRDGYVRSRLNASLAERGLQIVPEDDLNLYGHINGARSPMEKREGRDHGTQTETVKHRTRPTYIKVNRKHVSPETLEVYNLPWEWDVNDSQYIIIKQWVPEVDQLILFDHTKKLHEKRLPIVKMEESRHYKDKRDLERPKEDMGSDREDTWPDSRDSQALVLHEPRGRYSSHEHPPLQERTYNDGIRIRVHDRSPSPSPLRSPQLRPSMFSETFGGEDGPRDLNAKRSHRPPKSYLSSRVAKQSKVHTILSSDEDEDEDEDDGEDDDEDDDDFHEIVKDDEADLIAKTLSRYTTFKVDEDVTAGEKSSPLPMVRLTGWTNHEQDHANQNTIIEKTTEDDSVTERLQDEIPSSADHKTRSSNQSPSQSESEKELGRRADTQLYEADSEGSGREERRFERRDTWRRPTVEDEAHEAEAEAED